MVSLVRIDVVAEKLGGVHTSYAWRKLAGDPKAPKAIKLAARLTVFDEDEINRWIAGLVAAAKSKSPRIIGKAKLTGAA